MTELLTAAAVALGEAKASGGDRVRVARIGDEERIVGGSFDVLQGLVIAVDTKDRYTKRHSEDVARYAVFLAERLGPGRRAARTIHLAGLLHDVGKIGIPDVDPAQALEAHGRRVRHRSSSTWRWATRSCATCRTSRSSAPAFATTTSAGMARDTSRVWRGRRSR